MRSYRDASRYGAKAWLRQHATPQILELLHEQLQYVQAMDNEYDPKVGRLMLEMKMVNDLYIENTGKSIHDHRPAAKAIPLLEAPQHGLGGESKLRDRDTDPSGQGHD